jgi:bile acid:Na+ symporter, BASS family
MISQLINLLAAITLIEMMVTVGLGVALSDVLGVGKNWALVVRALIANYVLVPAAAVGLLFLFHANPMVAAGILVAAVCPGAPYAPPFTSLARGNVTQSVGLMLILAGSSAIVAPLLLGFLLPVLAGNTDLKINVYKMVGTLLGAQLLPLCLGLWIRHRRPVLADALKKPAGRLSLSLNLLLLAVILIAQFRLLAEIHVTGYFGMLCLLIATMTAGWVVGGHSNESSRSMVLTTAVRNVGVALVIVTGSFPGTAAITSATAYGLFQTIVIALVALAIGRFAPTGIVLVSKRAA